MPLTSATPEQLETMRAKATETRHAQAELLASVREGRVSPVDVLTDPSYTARGIRVVRLLKAVPGHGPVKAERLMNQAGVHRSRRVGGLGDRQRTKLTEALR